MSTAGTQEFDEEQEALAFLQRKMSAHCGRLLVPWSELHGHVPLVHSTVVKAGVPRGATPALVRRLRYVVKNEDLELFEALVDAAATAGAVAIPAADFAARWSALLGVLAGLIKVGRKAATKGVVLNKNHFLVLMTLHDGGSISFNSLLSTLRTLDSQWTKRALRDALDHLQKAPSLNKSEVQLVIELQGDRWTTTGI